MCLLKLFVLGNLVSVLVLCGDVNYDVVTVLEAFHQLLWL